MPAAGKSFADKNAVHNGTAVEWKTQPLAGMGRIYGSDIPHGRLTAPVNGMAYYMALSGLACFFLDLDANKDKNIDGQDPCRYLRFFEKGKQRV